MASFAQTYTEFTLFYVHHHEQLIIFQTFMKLESKFLDKQFEYFIILLGKTAISSVDIFHSENFYLC